MTDWRIAAQPPLVLQSMKERCSRSSMIHKRAKLQLAEGGRRGVAQEVAFASGSFGVLEMGVSARRDVSPLLIGMLLGQQSQLQRSAVVPCDSPASEAMNIAEGGRRGAVAQPDERRRKILRATRFRRAALFAERPRGTGKKVKGREIDVAPRFFSGTCASKAANHWQATAPRRAPGAYRLAGCRRRRFGRAPRRAPVESQNSAIAPASTNVL